MDTLPGEKLHLPLVAELGATRSHVARCVTWHSHPGENRNNGDDDEQFNQGEAAGRTGAGLRGGEQLHRRGGLGGLVQLHPPRPPTLGTVPKRPGARNRIAFTGGCMVYC